MNSFIRACIITLISQPTFGQTAPKAADTTRLQSVELVAIRASERMPVARTNISRETIEKNNTGADLPFILNQVPSVQVNSDAGNGIGYTGIRIRGTDASRVNMTINGIPYNDAESQGIFFVNLPDIASSAGSIQVQRGVGTSTNGAGSFGATINISTNDLSDKKETTFQNSAGSYGSLKNTVTFNSGRFGKNYYFNARASHIRSDGYIDRASTKLGSLYGSLAKVDSVNKIQLTIFTGREKTYQAWYGIDEETLKSNRRFNPAGMEKTGDPYDNETDNYSQTHYQLFYTRTINTNWKANAALFFTKGKGYYEQYKAGESLKDYGLPDYVNGTDTVRSTDLIRRLWLNNDFYGITYSLQHQQGGRQLILGGSVNHYRGRHFGEIVKTISAAGVPDGYRWYNLRADKTDINQFVKWTEQLGRGWMFFADMQLRLVNYNIHGFRNNPGIMVNKNYAFANPKAGISYQKRQTKVYLYYGQSSKEPNRDDFESGSSDQVKPERLHDWEAGIEQNGKKAGWSANLFYMYYRNQLVLTGKINDVGAYTRTNIPVSYRAGIELTGYLGINQWIGFEGNLALSRNRVRDFTEFVDDYDNGGQRSIFHGESDIAFSPSIITSTTVNVYPLKNTEISFIGKYVGKQYLDNTADDSRSLKAYYVQDLRVRYTREKKHGISWNAFLQLNNLFSRKYEANGYTFSYIYGSRLSTENYYFPMAGRNFMVGVNMQF